MEREGMGIPYAREESLRSLLEIRDTNFRALSRRGWFGLALGDK